MKLTKDEQVAFEILKIRLFQTSWDWESDYEFAYMVDDYSKEFLGDFKKILTSRAPNVFLYAAYKCLGCDAVKKRRLRALNNLKKKGLVRHSWSGVRDDTTDYQLIRVS